MLTKPAYNFRVNTPVRVGQIPSDIRTLLMPSPLKLPVYKYAPNPNKKTAKDRRKMAVTEIDSDAEDDDFIEIDVPEETGEYRRCDRYVPRFEAKTNHCWWEWIEYDLDSDGNELHNLDQIREDAWAALEKENRKRAKLQNSWWAQQP